jgi:hypothetical protein
MPRDYSKVKTPSAIVFAGTERRCSRFKQTAGGRRCAKYTTGFGADAPLSRPPAKILVGHVDMDRWFDRYDELSDAERDAITHFNMSGAGDTPPTPWPSPEMERFQHVLEQHDLGTVEDVTDQYVFFATDAPEAYDGFSTFTLGQWPVPELYHGTRAARAPWRLVAMLPRDVTWQTMRYRSGLHVFEKLWP